MDGARELYEFGGSDEHLAAPVPLVDLDADVETGSNTPLDEAAGQQMTDAEVDQPVESVHVEEVKVQLGGLATSEGARSMTMTYQEIRNRVAEEIALQDSVDNQIGPRQLPLAPDELFTGDEHTKIYLPRLEPHYFGHSIVVSSLDELDQIFSAAAELSGGRGLYLIYKAMLAIIFALLSGLSDGPNFRVNRTHSTPSY